MPSKSESEIQREILKHLKSHPKVAWIDRANSGKVKVKGGWMQLHEIGTPDLIGYSKKGIMIGIELKKEKEYESKNNGMSKEQLDRAGDMISHGCIWGVASSIEHVEDILARN